MMSEPEKEEQNGNIFVKDSEGIPSTLLTSLTRLPSDCNPVLLIPTTSLPRASDQEEEKFDPCARQNGADCIMATEPQENTPERASYGTEEERSFPDRLPMCDY